MDGDKDEEPEACDGDRMGCSLNRYPLYDACDHLRYPFLDLTASKGCNVQKCKLDNRIDRRDVFKEVKTLFGTIFKTCQGYCKDKKPPTCDTPIPP